jgi:hypothetical protein
VVQCCRSLTGKLGCWARDRSRLIAQRSSAVRTIRIIYANHTLALRTAWAQFVAAARAEVESRLNGVPALRAGAPQWLPEYEVENDAQSVGNKNGNNRPKDRAHAAAFRVAVYIADEQHKRTQHQAEQKSKQGPRPCRRCVRVPSHYNIKENLRDEESNRRQRPRPRRNNLDFRRQSSLSFVFYLHKFVGFLIAINAIVLRCWSNKCRGPATTRPPPVLAP